MIIYPFVNWLFVDWFVFVDLFDDSLIASFTDVLTCPPSVLTTLWLWVTRDQNSLVDEFVSMPIF